MDKMLKTELFDVLISIVEPSIKEKDLEKIIDKMIMPIIENIIPEERKSHKNELCNANADGHNACRQEMRNNMNVSILSLRRWIYLETD